MTNFSSKSEVLVAVAQDGKSLRSASAELRADRAVVLAAVAQNGWALGHASEALRQEIMAYEKEHQVSSHKALIALISQEPLHKAYTAAATEAVLCASSGRSGKGIPSVLASRCIAGFFTRTDAAALACTHWAATRAGILATQETIPMPSGCESSSSSSSSSATFTVR